MKLNRPTADLYVPDELPLPGALSRTTHLGIGAHQDDLEIMAFHGILECYGLPDQWFTGVTCTNGAGSPRAGVYAAFTDELMQTVRRREQRQAAAVGQYAAMLQLDHPSSTVKDPANPALVDDLTAILEATRPTVVYTHNPADKHDTHIGVMAAAVRAMRRLPLDQRPRKVYGCEVWRALDWLPDADKVALDVSARENLAQALTGLFDSQIAGGKRYDLATLGRRRANATYAESHGVDQADQLCFALDLTPVVHNDKLDLVDYVVHFIRSFETDVRQRIAGRWPAQ
jgi:LmbE family N-acetylglucosaminyl deacetylase